MGIFLCNLYIVEIILDIIIGTFFRYYRRRNKNVQT